MARIVPAGIYGEEARKILVQNHPELQGMSLNEVRLIEPVQPLVKGESRFFQAENDARFQAVEQWANEPSVDHLLGGGHGLAAVVETPIFIREEKSTGVPDFENTSSYILVSRKCLDILESFDSGHIESKAIHRRNRNGVSLGEYLIIDVLRRVPAIDWGNSHIRAEGVRWPLPPHDLRVSLRVANGYRIRQDIAEGVHIFRDERDVSRVFVSLELKAAMEAAGVTGVVYSDPAGLLALNPPVQA